MKYIPGGSLDQSIPFALKQGGLTVTEFKYSYTRYSRGVGTTFVKVTRPVLAELASLATLHTDDNARFFEKTTLDDPAYFELRLDVVDAAFAIGADYVVIGLYDDADNEIGHEEVLLDSITGDNYNGKLKWDSISGVAGAVKNINGTSKYPSNTQADFLSLIDQTGIKRLDITGLIPTSLGGNQLKNALVEGIGMQSQWSPDTSNDYDYSYIKNFETVDDTGDACYFLTFENSGITSMSNDIDNYKLRNCRLNNDVDISPGITDQRIEMIDCKGLEFLLTIDGFNDKTFTFSLSKHTGDVKFVDFIKAGQNAYLHLMGGTVTIDAGCVLGTITVTGWGNLIDNSTGTVVTATGFQEVPIASGEVTLEDNAGNKSVIAAGTWDSLKSAHTGTGSFGEYVVAQLKDDAVNKLIIENACWDAARASHVTAGTFGEKVLANIIELAGSSTVDGVSLTVLYEILLSYISGRFKKDVPSTGDITFYKQDNSTVLYIMHVTDIERTRI